MLDTPRSTCPSESRAAADPEFRFGIVRYRCQRPDVHLTGDPLPNSNGVAASPAPTEAPTRLRRLRSDATLRRQRPP